MVRRMRSAYLNEIKVNKYGCVFSVYEVYF